MGLFDVFRRRVKEVVDEADAEALTADEGSEEATEALALAESLQASDDGTSSDDEPVPPEDPPPVPEPDDEWEDERSFDAPDTVVATDSDEVATDDEWDEWDEEAAPSPFEDASSKARKARRKERNKRGLFSRSKEVVKEEVARPAGSLVDLSVLRSTTGRRLVEVAAAPRGSSGPTQVAGQDGPALEIDLGGGVVESGGRVINPSEALEDLLEELELILLEADMGSRAIDFVLGAIRKELIGRRLRKGADLGRVIEASLKRALRSLLASGYWDLDATIDRLLSEEGSPAVIMLVGVNGTGKTTTTAKLANRLTKAGRTVVLAAADTFRAGAIDQLETHAERLGVRCVSNQRGGDSAAISRDAIESARARGADVVLIDTAGRMQNKTNLMEELRKVHRVTKPHLVLFVGDALAGNDAVEQAVEFQRILAFDGFVLCKLDTDAKGGAALSIAHATGRPIVMVGVGQGYDDLLPFDPDSLLDEMFA